MTSLYNRKKTTDKGTMRDYLLRAGAFPAELLVQLTSDSHQPTFSSGETPDFLPRIFKTYVTLYTEKEAFDK